jgi:hypothetical protein
MIPEEAIGHDSEEEQYPASDCMREDSCRAAGFGPLLVLTLQNLNLLRC